MGSLVYFSSVSENTHRFVQRLGLRALNIDVQRIPLRPTDGFLRVHEPYVLVVPTYGGGNEGGAVPRQVVKFLNDVHNRSLIRGVIAAGNTNFGEAYCIAGDIISAKCQVPYLYAFELLGTAEDATRVRDGLGRFWQRQSQIPA
ncbi:class Ib ribonucleoside-diphosphate reductase assembly flavoprotein NrdI [Cellulosimicrobium arenosum]|uniref:Protein NrdI n=1 Tax=Cellulosimicrobium arenosum TaxID=2708133 RepID=A0A927J1D1_9MICO|nr:class Ib ribonucleoside-diphosphate reductase assembly flavoprotein NrdI [Cellulosimicrobium arenosum]